MKNLCLFIALVLFGYTALSAQNTVTISPRIATINIGETATFSIFLTAQSGFDGSVFLWPQNPRGVYSGGTITPTTVVNNPYTVPLAYTIKFSTSSKRGTYTFYISAKFGATTVYDSCVVEVVNSTPFRIFGQSNLVGCRPTFINVDKYGEIFYSLLPSMSDELSPINLPNEVYSTTITNPVFNRKFQNGINAQGAFAIIQDKDSTSYCLSLKGLWKFQGIQASLDKGLTIYNKLNSDIPSDTVKRGVLDNNGRLWVGTPQGLASLENYTITRYDNSNTNSILGNERITALATDANNRIWIGTPNGLVMKDGNIWTRYIPENSGLPAPYIFGLTVDKNGAVWMGTGKNVYDNYYSDIHGNYDRSYNDCPDSMVGLARFDGTNWTLFNSTNSPLTSNYVNSLMVDGKGNLWVGTASNRRGPDHTIVSGCGLLKYDGTTWTTFNTSNSLLPDNDVQWVGADRYGNIWFVCKEMFGAMNEEGIPFLVNDVSEQPAESDGIHLFPNPTSTQFTLSGVEGVASVRVVNSLGEEVRKWSEGQGTREIDVSNLANGLYFVSIRTVTGAVVKPIIVSH